MLYNPKHKFSVIVVLLVLQGDTQGELQGTYVILRNEKNAKKKKKSTVLNNRALRLLTNPPLAKKVGLSVVWKLFVCTKSFALRAFSPPSAAVPGGITAFITFLPESFAPFGAAQNDRAARHSPAIWSFCANMVGTSSLQTSEKSV